MHELKRATCNLRVWLICLTAVSVSLPMVWISLAKVLVFVYALVFLAKQVLTRHADHALAELWTPWAVTLMLVCSATSMLWSAADLSVALVTFVKHSKLLEIVLLVSLIRTAAEARTAITVFACGQAFMLLSSWLMFLGVNVPWHAHAPTPYVVFSTYLDQSIMFATVASVFWHLRHEKLWSPVIGAVCAALAIANTLLVLEGRSGYLVALAALALAIMWAVPRRLRLAAFVIAPIVILAAVTLGSNQVQERIGKIITESQNFAKTQKVEVGDSSGWRLNAWRRSVQAMVDRPLQGYGVGAWTFAVKRMEGSTATEVFGESNQSNPHQEYLLWGVELGVGGLLLFLSTLVCLARDAQQFRPPIKRAAMAVLVSIAVACMFNSALYDDLMGDFLVVAMGLLMALGTRSMAVGRPQMKGIA
jgi:O-antigen ligase